MQCLACRHDNPAQAKFCLECGTQMTRCCSKCRAELPTSAKFCLECGERVAASSAAAEPRLPSPDAYTPSHLAERILTSKAALEGERKRVTVLFADLKGSTELLADRDPEDARTILDPVLELMMESVHRYEGTVNQVMGDGIMALFGAPLAHEDHAVRACYAALRMQDVVRHYSSELRRAQGVEVQIRVGLNSGEVVVRSIGSDLRMDYTAVGQTTHLAARMEQLAAPGSIRLTAETLNLAEGFVQITPLGPVPVKGISEPVEVFELIGAGAARTRLEAAARRGLTRFVGRNAELEQLRGALDLASLGRGQVVAVVGEPGVGKSRLFWELTRSHRVHGWLVLQSASVSYGKANAYLPVIELLRGYFEIDSRDDARKIREKVTGKIVTLAPTLAPAVPAILALLEVPVPDASWQTLDPRQRRQQTLDAVKRLLLRESEVQPLIVVFEDLHWIDAETQIFVDSLIESLPAARLLLLVNYRPEYQHGWGGKTYYRQIRIDPLPPESADELLDALLGSDVGLRPLKQLLVERTEANPLFLEESVRALVDMATLAGERGAYRLTRSVEQLMIPATVQAILAARIDRLAPEAKRLLQAAAVIGKDVPMPLLQAIVDAPEHEVRAELTHLQAGEFLYETRLFPDLEYTFKHALTHEVAYQGLVRERRRVLHERALHALEQQWAGRERETIELLAHHAVQAELWHRAARHLYHAGEKAFSQGRYQAGATSYQATVEALDRLGHAADLTLKLDACLQLWSARSTIGQYDGLRDLGEKAEALARALDDGPRLAQVQVRQAQAIAASGVIPGPLSLAIEQARDAFKNADPRDLRTRSYAQYIVGLACRDRGRIEEAVREYGAGLALFEPPGSHDDQSGLVLPIYVSLSAWRAEAYATLGDFQQAFAAARDALRVATDIRHPSSLAVANIYLGYVHLLRGEAESAVPLLERALAIASEHELHLGKIRAGCYLAHIRVLHGERERGLECLAQVFERPTGAGNAEWHGHATATGYGTVTASTYLIAGCTEEARVEIRQGLAAAAERNAESYRAPLLRLEAEVLAHEAPAGARARLDEALTLAEELRMRPDAAHCHFGLARLYQRTGQREQAYEHLVTAMAMYREMDMRFWSEKAEAEMKER